MVDELNKKKEVGDEMTLMLASKWLRKNITVITSKRDCPHDIVVTYKGKDRYMRGKWAASQMASCAPTTAKKASKYFYTNIFVHSFKYMYVMAF